MSRPRRLSFGPGLLVTAAFIGPGTVTVCTTAGARFGFALLWALVFAALATIVLQDMAARLGAGARLGLGEAMMRAAGGAWGKAAVAGLVIAALVLGNSAYEAGNLAGGALGIGAAFGLEARAAVVLGLAALAAGVLATARYRLLERVLVGLVLTMSAAFVLSAALTRPDWGAVAAGLRLQIPAAPEGGLLTAIALIGTTIVPYNLFLHAAAARRRWEADAGAGPARADSALSVGLGGLVSMAILAAAASLVGQGLVIANAADMARAVEPAFGPLARLVVGLGLAAAGLTSAITAPMATGYAVCEIVNGVQGAPGAPRPALFRATALGVLAFGTATAALAVRPTALILIAQAANAVLLPVVAAFLLRVMNRRDLLGAHANALWSNVMGGAVVLVALGLGLRGLLRAMGLWP